MVARLILVTDAAVGDWPEASIHAYARTILYRHVSVAAEKESLRRNKRQCHFIDEQSRVQHALDPMQWAWHAVVAFLSSPAVSCQCMAEGGVPNAGAARA